MAILFDFSLFENTKMNLKKIISVLIRTMFIKSVVLLFTEIQNEKISEIKRSELSSE